MRRSVFFVLFLGFVRGRDLEAKEGLEGYPTLSRPYKNRKVRGVYLFSILV